jgi:type I restriction enzyme, S subunit
MTVELLLKHFERISEAPDAVARLRRFILDLAVRGKLVDQDPSDEPATALFERALTEHASPRKTQKPNGASKLPTGWVPVVFGWLISLKKGKKPHSLNNAGIGFPYLDIAALDRGEIRQYTEDEKCPRATLRDLIIVCDGSRSGLVLDGREGVLGSTVASIQFSGFERSYLRVLLRALYEDLNSAKKGAAIPHLNIPRLLSLELGLPPHAEQHRIVSKVGELMALCDQLQAAQNEREARRDRLVAASLNRIGTAPVASDEAAPEAQSAIPLPDAARFHLDRLTRLTTRPEHIKQLRQTILNLAVRGRLVPQDPNDEPAAELLKWIGAEMTQLVKDGERKKGAPLPDVDLEQAPFDLPLGWSWARFPELGIFGRGKSKHRPRNDVVLFDGGTHPLIQTGDVARSKGVIRTYTNKYNDTGLAQSMKWPAGTLCITIAANIADSGILSFDACFPDSVVGFIPASMFKNARYFEYFMRTARANLLEFAPATAQKNINLEILNAVLIPIPPLAEQDRIVAKVDELMDLCDQLEVQLTATLADSGRLLEAALHEAQAPAMEQAA